MTTPPTQPTGYNPPDPQQNNPQQYPPQHQPGQNYQQQGYQYPGQPQPSNPQYPFGQPGTPGMPPMDPKAQAKAAKAYQKASRPWFKKKRFWALGLLLLLIIGSALGGGSDTSNQPEDETALSAQAASTEAQAPAQPETDKPDEATEAPAPAATGAKLGETVPYNTFEFTVNSVKCGLSTVGSDSFQEEAQGQFCVVSMKVKNTGTKAQHFMSDDQKLFDAQGNEYSYSTEGTIATMGDKSDLWFEEINPGNSVTGEIVFDIPEGVKPAKIHLSDGGFTDQGIDVLLG